MIINLFVYLQPKINNFKKGIERRCIKIMLIIPVKDGENIDRALKRFKRKFDRTKTMKQLRERKQFTKPSVLKRQQLLKARYVQRIRTEEEKG